MSKPDKNAENRRSEQKGESRHGKHPAETVEGVEEWVGSKHPANHRFKLPADHEVTDHSNVRADLD